MKDDFLPGKPTPPMPQAGPPATTRVAAPPAAANASGTDAKSKTGTTPPAVKAPSPALPKGGGAIRGLGEKFAANPVTGTGSMSVPIATTPGRNGFAPDISLAYDSSASNGPFGAGWHLSVPSITRKTEKGLPRYSDISDSDVFILSGAEDLVPKLDFEGGAWVRDIVEDSVDRRIDRYRPRIEGLFARIERITDRMDGNVYWRATTKDNVTSIYGKSHSAKISDPNHTDEQHARRVFSWLLEKTVDAYGNVILYEYKPEDLTGVQRGVLHEKRRVSGEVLVTNRYLKRIRYGNTTPNDEIGLTCVFEVVFDYGEHDLDEPTPTDHDEWGLRADPFSSYRATFEIRTYRLCRRVLMFHRFTELGSASVLVCSTDFTYEQSPILSRLIKVTQSGYIKTDEGYTKKSLPPLELGYSLPEIQTEVKLFDPKSLQHLPSGVDGQTARWVDLDGEGIAGVLYQQPDGQLFYKQNLGGGQLAPARLLTQRPAMTAGPAGRQELLDLAHEGKQHLVEFARPVRYHERTPEGGWGPAVPFRSQPNVNWNDPRVRFIDLTGDGFDDLLVPYEGGILWYPSLGKGGFGPGRRFPVHFDDDKSPTLVLGGGTQAVFVADMTGDGLPDIVRVRNGNICYWPNLGYGRFGAKVSMSGAPRFDSPSQFDPRRIRLADIDGTGTTDILYVGADGILIAFNQSGNSWSAPTRLPRFPTADAMSTVAVLDLLGTGTSCLVWSSPWKGVAQPPMRYVDLLGSKKPYLLTSVKNNMGCETRLQYTTSTTFYLEDLKAGKPWITRLPFPVHVVERVEVYDAVSKTRFVNTYRYHHGYYDGPEREFRGFGFVEQYDTEYVSAEKGKGLFPEVEGVLNNEMPQPPVLTKTWFHLGNWHHGGERISQQFEGEYYDQDSEAVHLPDTRLPAGLSPKETLEACRALRGRILRQEVYGLDGSAAERHPYTVAEFTYEIRRIQPVEKNPHAVFATFSREVLTVHYERDPSDPRMQHAFTLAVDDYGNVTKSAAVGYGRRPVLDAKPEQTNVLATYIESTVANEAAQTAWYRIGVPVESKTYELTGLPVPTGAIYTFNQMSQSAMSAAAISYEAVPDGSLQKRLIERVRQNYYDSTNLPGPPLPFGQLDALALPYETYALAFNDNLIAQAYGDRAANPAMLLEGGHLEIADSGEWWVPSGRQVFDATRFYLPVQVIDPFNETTTIEYDSYALFVTTVTDPRNNVIAVQNDYRTMSPVLITEPNGNRAAVKLDELGMVVATAVMGKPGGTEGDTLDDPTTTVNYDLDRWRTSGLPNVIHAAARERHQDTQTPWQHTYAYFDGMGREAMKKIRAAPGLAPKRVHGELVYENGALVLEHTETRWTGTGRTVLDNKGNPIKQYEPFFSSTHEHEDEQELVQWGVTSIFHYDPLGRLIRTDRPDGARSRVEFTPWMQKTWDENDTVMEPGNLWHAARQPGAKPMPSAEDQRAATLAAAHADTPSVVHLDVLGRPFVAIADNGAAGQYETHTTLDIEGDPLAIKDGRGNMAMQQKLDMLGRTLYWKSMDSGERWTLPDVAGNPIRSWDGCGHTIRRVYDGLRRLINLWVRKKGTADEILAEKTVYGEDQPNPEAANLRGKVYQVYDGAGVLTHASYDFKGNLLQSQRKLAREYQSTLDWSAAPLPAVDSETFTETMAYDALNRITSATKPDQSEIRPTYNEAGLLEKVEVRIRGAAEWTVFVEHIDYNARGQREKIAYGNGAVTEYTYDTLTFRLTRLKTTRTSDNKLLQDLRYTYDPVGNIVKIQDHAQKEVYWNNDLVTPHAAYEYDALYQLINASGREHAGQKADIQQDENGFPLVEAPHPNDPQVLRSYIEHYKYDEVGNILKMIHQVPGGNGGWTRRYEVDTASNRLLSTSLPGDAETAPYSAKYTHDEHGNMLSMPHLASVEWDFKDQMCEVDLGGGGKEYYVYNSAGQRVRKVWEHSGLIEEWTYHGRFDVYQKRVAMSDEVLLERETLHVMDNAHRIAVIETKTVDVEVPAFTPESRTRYQLGNHLGSAMLELDDDGLAISYEEYHPYGTTAYHAVASGLEVTAKRYRYTGKERDEETGVYYYGARYYAAWLGRWTSADPAGLEDGPNQYAYVRGNPIRFHDRTGTVVPDVPNPLWDALFRRPQVARQTGLAAGFLAPAPAAPAGGPQGGGSQGTAPFVVGGLPAKNLPPVRFPPLRLAPPPPPPTPPRIPVGGTGPGPAAAIAVGIVVLIAGAWYLKAKLGDDKDPGVSTPPPPPPGPPSSAATPAPAAPEQQADEPREQHPATTQPGGEAQPLQEKGATGLPQPAAQVEEGTTTPAAPPPIPASASPGATPASYPQSTTYGKNALEKFRKHVEQIRRTTGKPVGKVSSAEGQEQIKAIIDDIVQTGETRQIPWGQYHDAIWSKKGDAIVIRQSTGEFVTFLESGKGGALKWR